MKNFRFEMTKVYSKIPPPPPPMKNFRFEMTKVYSKIPPQWKTSDLKWPKFTPKYPPPPHEKLQIWDDQSLLQSTPQWKTSDLKWPKFTPKYPPPMKNFRFEMTKVYFKIPLPPNEKLQIWDDQSLLQNTPPSCWWEFPYVETYIYHTDNILVSGLWTDLESLH